MSVCGTGSWSGPLPGDPDNNITLAAVTAFGGINVTVTYPATNPHAVAYFILYRATVPDFDLAVELGKMSGSLYHDKIVVEVDTTYYYWVRIVSINGTIHSTIGPVGALALKFSGQILDELDGQVPMSALNGLLQAEILNIQTLETNLISETNARIAAHEGLSTALAEVDAGLVDAMSYINTETTQRIDGQNALAQQIDVVAAANDTTMAAVITEQTTRASEDASLASQITALIARLNDTGESLTLEQRLVATASLIDGLRGQYSLKIASGTEADPVIAGFALAMHDPVEGPTTSAFTILADAFALHTAGGKLRPFAVVGDTVFIDGQLRVGSSDKTIANLTDSMIVSVGEFAAAPDPDLYRANDVYRNTTDGNTYILKVTGGVKSWSLWIKKGDPGVNGTDGLTMYTWIRYADDASGTGLSDSPTGKTHIGLAYNKNSPVESSDPTDYSWTLIKGTDGVPGAPGVNGVTTYTWIKYSDNPDGTGMYDVPNTDTLYIGLAVNKTTSTEGTNKADYIWSKFKGDQGVPGQDGQTTYTWIKYADSAAGAGLSDDPTGKSYIGFAYNKTTPTESINASDYSWALIKGTDGVPGAPGINGTTTYTWIKYSDSSDGTDLYDTPNSNTQYIGIAVNKTTATESTVKTDYVWSKFKGDQGVPGTPGTPGSDGSNGQRGTVQIIASGSSWSDTTAYNAIVAATGTAPMNHDQVTITNGSFVQTRVKSGASWIIPTAYIDGNLIVDGTFSVSGDMLSGGTISGVGININGNFVVSTSGSTQIYVANLVRGTASNGDAPGLPCFKATSSGSGAAFEAVGGSSGNALNITSGINGIVQNGGGSNYLRNVLPSTDNAYSLGASGSLRFTALFAMSSTITTSDERTKFDIRPLNYGLNICRELQTILYKQKVAENIVTDNWVEVEPQKTVVDDFGDLIVTAEAVIENQPIITPRTGVRDHAGVLAQQLKVVLDKYGMGDCGVWSMADPNDPDSLQAVRYEELIPFAINGISTLADKLDAQEARIKQLEDMFAAFQTQS